MSSQKQVEVKCPHCGAQFWVPEGASRVTCPYCFTVFNVSDLKLEGEEHFYFPLSRTLDPFERLVKFVSRQYAVPIDLPKRFSVQKRELYWVPVYFFFADFRARARGYSQAYGEQYTDITETRLVSIPVSGTWLDTVLEKYPFPVRGKLPFSPEIEAKGVFLKPTVARDEAEKKAENIVAYKVRLEASQSFSALKSLELVEKKLEYRGLVHYPVWVLGYSYNDRDYSAIVDGASGVVIKAEYPQTTKGRATLTAYSILALLSGVAGGLLYSYLFENGFLAIIGGLIVGGAAALPALTRSATRIASASEYLELE